MQLIRENVSRPLLIQSMENSTEKGFLEGNQEARGLCEIFRELPFCNSVSDNLNPPRNSSQEAMAGWADVYAYVKGSIEDFKVQLRRVYEVVCKGFQENREIASDIRYISYQLSCRGSRIDDLDRNLKELIGTVDLIKEEILKMAKKQEILKMAKMSQYSHCQESLTDGVRPMEETSVLQRVKSPRLMAFVRWRKPLFFNEFMGFQASRNNGNVYFQVV